MLLAVSTVLSSSFQCEAVQLEELSLHFAGPLPLATQDETQMLAQRSRCAMTDPLLENERVKALVIKIKDGQYLG